MNELQKLCDKVPSFDDREAMEVLRQELGQPWQELFAELSPQPIAAASLGQVYRGRLKTGEDVAVKARGRAGVECGRRAAKGAAAPARRGCAEQRRLDMQRARLTLAQLAQVQRPGVLETVTVDLYVLRKVGVFLRRFPQIGTDTVGLLDEWAARFFEELDYVREGENATKFAEQFRYDLPQARLCAQPPAALVLAPCASRVPGCRRAAREVSAWLRAGGGA